MIPIDWLKKKNKHRLVTISLDDPDNDETRNLVAPPIDLADEEAVEEAAEEEKKRHRLALIHELKRMGKRERRIFILHLKNINAQQIAGMMNEDVRIIRHDLNVIRNRVRPRLMKLMQKGQHQPG